MWSLARTVEPVPVMTTGSARRHCRIDLTSDDAYVEGLVAAATELFEEHTGRQLAVATWRLTLDCFPYRYSPLQHWPPQTLGSTGFSARGGRLRLPRPPFVSLTSILYDDTDGVERTLDLAKVRVALDEPAILEPAFGQVWPPTRPQTGAVRVTYKGGYAKVPTLAIHAIRMTVAHWYENREAVGEVKYTEVPLGVRTIWDRYLVPAIGQPCELES